MGNQKGVILARKRYSAEQIIVNVLPLPTSLSTPIDPPSSSANFFVIDSPNPVPFCTLLSDPSARRYYRLETRVPPARIVRVSFPAASVSTSAASPSVSISSDSVTWPD